MGWQPETAELPLDFLETIYLGDGLMRFRALFRESFHTH
jgi:hypothetical protein